MITSTNSAIIRKTGNGAFYKGLQGMPGGADMKQFATTYSTTGINGEFGWFGSLPAVTEFTGSKQYKGLTPFTHTITPKEWDLSLAFKERTFEDDVTGTAATAAGAVVSRCNDHLNVRLTAFLESGTGSTYGTAYDAQYFFDDDHHGTTDAAHDNDLTGAAATGTSPTASEAEAAIGAMLAAARGFVDDASQPYTANPNRFTVVYPTEFSHAMSVVLGSNGTLGTLAGNSVTNQDSGVTGRYYGMTGVCNPHLANADAIYLLAKPGMGSAGPLVINLRRPWEFMTYDSTNSELCADSREVRMTSYGVYEVGYAVWQDAVSYIFT